MRWSDAAAITLLNAHPGLPDAWWRSLPMPSVLAAIGPEPLGDLLTEIALEHWPAAAVGDILPALHVLDPDEADEPHVAIALDRAGSWAGLLNLTSRELMDQPFIQARQVLSTLFSATLVRLAPAAGPLSPPQLIEKPEPLVRPEPGRQKAGDKAAARAPEPTANAALAAEPVASAEPVKDGAAKSVSEAGPLNEAEPVNENGASESVADAEHAADAQATAGGGEAAEGEAEEPEAAPASADAAHRPAEAAHESADADAEPVAAGHEPADAGHESAEASEPGAEAVHAAEPVADDGEAGRADEPGAQHDEAEAQHADEPGHEPEAQHADGSGDAPEAPQREAEHEPDSEHDKPEHERDEPQPDEPVVAEVVEAPHDPVEEPPAVAEGAPHHLHELVEAAFAGLDDKSWAVAQNRVFTDAPSALDQLAKLFAVPTAELQAVEADLHARLRQWLDSQEAAPYREHLDSVRRAVGQKPSKEQLLQVADWHRLEVRPLEVPAWQFVLATLTVAQPRQPAQAPPFQPPAPQQQDARPLKDVALTKRCFRQPDGRWWLRVDVTAEQLQGGECPLPSGFAAYLNLNPGESRTVRSAAGELALSWHGRPVLESVGKLLQDVGAKEGGHLFLTLSDEGVLRARHLPVASDSAEPITRALRLVGYTAPGGTLDQAARVIATRIGMAGPVSLSDLKARLRERGDRDLLALLD
ncbi:hypothetical protein [Nonomuraea soli]|uniref:Uncharacterized protein n=1 Tax=Nonomuraea soli TaxID=1032476 RepID=A0A7W0CRC7_9ACTN|nr:hypothetical protein [Nonomuraea soli]MBA2895784.1 hypothetical protein [Nonomuraea soli]